MEPNTLLMATTPLKGYSEIEINSVIYKLKRNLDIKWIIIIIIIIYKVLRKDDLPFLYYRMPLHQIQTSLVLFD